MLNDIDKALVYFGPSSDLSSLTKYYLNRGAALALKMDVLMWFKDYDEALVVSEDLINNYKYELAQGSAYASQFLNPESSKEMIFNLYWDYAEDGNGFGYAQRLASGSNTIMYHPRVEIYKSLVERKYDDIRVTMVMDTFFIHTFVNPDAISLESYELAYEGKYGNAANFQIKCPKFAEFNSTENSGLGGYDWVGNAYDNTKMPIYRLADIILLRAEALALKSSPDLEGAIKIVNTIRERAGYKKEATLTEYPTADKVLDLIIDERTIEFWAEGKRWFDLVRNDKVKQYLDPILSSNNDDEENPLGFEIGAPKPSPDHIGGYGRILWPLNQDVFKKNPIIQQNPPYTK
jgi:hypothetical protein